MVIIIQTGTSNLGSIVNILKKISIQAKVSNDITEIMNASHLILPGVGSFDAAMHYISDIKNLIVERVQNDRIPILGICLGLQLMTKGSEEGNLAGLGLVDATIIRFQLNNTQYKIPHMGWNKIHLKKKFELLDGTPEDPRFYFVHSFHLSNIDTELILATTEYGYSFPSAFLHNHICGVQFHPEKSHKFGISFLKNYFRMLEHR